MDEKIFKALSRIRNDAPGVRSDSPTLRPFAVDDGDGGLWTVFTDGYQLVAVRGACEGVEPYTGSLAADLSGRLFPYLSTTYGEGEEHVADFADLAAWVGRPSCSVCGGVTPHHREPDADQLLNVHLPNLGALYGVPVNRNLLAYTFAYLRAEVLQIIVRPKAPVLLVAPTWRVLLQVGVGRVYSRDAFPRQAEEEACAA